MNSISAPTATHTEVIGHFDYALEGRAYGWAFAPAHPHKRLVIEVLVGGEVVGYGRADRFREDLKTAGISDGCCLFDLQLSHELLDGRVYSLTARDAETGVVLSGSPHAFSELAPENSYPQIPRARGLELLSELLSEDRYKTLSSKLRNFCDAYRLASRLQETGEFLEARSAWMTINNALGQNALGYCKLGECLLLEGALAEALEAFSIAAGADLRMHWAHLGIANSQYALRKYQEAEAAMQIAVALQPQDIDLNSRHQFMKSQALPERIEALVSQDKRDEAIDLLISMLLNHPEDTQALEMIGTLLCGTDGPSSPGGPKLKELRKAERTLSVLLDKIELRLNEVI
ncbi:TPA: tetratricopeptide repeat protein [Pseudomonas putida]